MRISDATKIPRMLSAKALLIILPLLILVGGVATFALAYASEDPKIKDVVITNVTYNSATVTWETETPVKGRVVVSKSSENKFPNLFEKVLNYYEKSYDDRNIEQVENDNTFEYSYSSEIAKDRTIHHVSIRNLEPLTEYSFQIDGNLKTFGREDYKFTTLENPVSIQDPKTVYGDVQVVYVDEGGIPQQIVTEGIDGVVIYSVEGGFDTKVMSTIISSDAKWTADISYPYGVYQQNSNEDTIPEFSATVKTQAGRAGISTYDFISPVGGVVQIETVSVIVEQASEPVGDVSVGGGTRGTGGSCSSNGDCSAGLSCCNCITGQKLCSAPGGNCSTICQTTPGTTELKVQCYVPENGKCELKEGSECAKFNRRYSSLTECNDNYKDVGQTCSRPEDCKSNVCCNGAGCNGLCAAPGGTCDNFCERFLKCYKPNLPTKSCFSSEFQRRECPIGEYIFESDCKKELDRLTLEQSLAGCYIIENMSCKQIVSGNECSGISNKPYKSKEDCEEGLKKSSYECYAPNEARDKQNPNAIQSDCIKKTYTKEINEPAICNNTSIENRYEITELRRCISEVNNFDFKNKYGYPLNATVSCVYKNVEKGLCETIPGTATLEKPTCKDLGFFDGNIDQCNATLSSNTQDNFCIDNCDCNSNNNRRLEDQKYYCQNKQKIVDCDLISTKTYLPPYVDPGEIQFLGSKYYSNIPGIAYQKIKLADKEFEISFSCARYDNNDSGWVTNNISEFESFFNTNSIPLQQSIPIERTQLNVSFDNVINSDSLISVSAQPLGPETITPDLLNRGVYKLDIEGYGSAEFTIYADGIKVQYFEDTNGDGIKQESETFIDLTQYQIQISKQQELKPYTFNTGWNSVTFNIISENLETASEVVTALSAQGIRVEQISRFDKGQWLHFVVEPTASGVNSTYGTDFKIIPGQGYFIRTLNQGTAFLTGNTFESSVPITLESGWNLIGVQSPTDYTANQFLDICNSQNASCINISQYDQGIYDSVVIDEGVFFGNNFEIKDNEGYFLLNEGGGVTIRP